jgi:hypothetical protein
MKASASRTSPGEGRGEGVCQWRCDRRLLATVAMWPSGLETVRVNRQGDLRTATGKPEASV